MGLNLIGWPDGERRRHFFGQLMPARTPRR